MLFQLSVAILPVSSYPLYWIFPSHSSHFHPTTFTIPIHILGQIISLLFLTDHSLEHGAVQVFPQYVRGWEVLSRLPPALPSSGAEDDQITPLVAPHVLSRTFYTATHPHIHHTANTNTWSAYVQYILHVSTSVQTLPQHTHPRLVPYSAYPHLPTPVCCTSVCA